MIKVTSNRISAQQKNAMLTIHFIELAHGLHTPVHTSYLRKKVELSLSTEIAKNNFSVGLRKLVDSGYMVLSKNVDKCISANAYDGEGMWQLTNKGRAYAEELHSARLRPKRTYTTKSN